MKKCILIVLLVILYLSGIKVCGSERKTGINVGLKGGTFFLNDVNSFNIFSFGGVVSYTLPFKNPYFETTLEGDFNLGYFGGDYVSGASDDKSHVRTFGAYGVFSSIPSNSIFLRGKIGVTHETEFETRLDEETIYRNIGPSFGIGVGYNATDNANLELEFTTTNSDMTFYSIALKFFL
jgi:hypothetical protein